MFGSVRSGARLVTAENWATNEDHLFAVDLFNAGYYWEAHVFWERLWAVEGTDPAVRAFLQGLVQLSAACLKRRQDRLKGALKLVSRARASFSRAASGGGGAKVTLGVDAGRLSRDVERFENADSDAPGPMPRIDLVGA